jgi:uncharacterized protein involved in outer membrane biogenesis
MKIMRKIGLGLLAFLALLLVTMLVLKVAINPNDYKEMLRQGAAQQGIELAMHGDMQLSFFPHPALELKNIDAALPVNGERQTFHAEALSMKLSIESLLARQIAFSDIAVNDISTPLVMVNGKQQPFTVQATAVQFDSRADALKIDALTLEIANLQLTAKIAGQQVTHSPVITADPLAVKFANGSVHDIHLNGNLQWKAQDAGHAVLNLAGDKLLLNHMVFTNVVLAAEMEGNKVTLNNLQADAYGGHIQNTGSLLLSDTKNSDAKNPKLKLNTSVKGLQLSPFLADLRQTPSKIAAGVLQLDSHLVTVPLNQEKMLRNLSGNVEFIANGLIIDEVNLERRVCESAALLDGKSLSARQWTNKTELREARGTAQIHNGIAYLAPLTAKMDTLALNGNGPINLLNDTLDLQLDLKLLNDNQAANFCEAMNPRLTNISWPLRCEGNYIVENGKDLCGIDKSRLEKLALQAAAQKLEGKLKDKLKDLIRGF